MVAPLPFDNPAALQQQRATQDVAQRAQNAEGQRADGGRAAEAINTAQTDPNRTANIERAARPADPVNQTEAAPQQADRGGAAAGDRVDLGEEAQQIAAANSEQATPVNTEPVRVEAVANRDAAGGTSDTAANAAAADAPAANAETGGNAAEAADADAAAQDARQANANADRAAAAEAASDAREDASDDAERERQDLGSVLGALNAPSPGSLVNATF